MLKVESTNIQRQKNKIAAITKKRNSDGWRLFSTNTTTLDTKNLFSNLYLFWEKQQ